VFNNRAYIDTVEHEAEDARPLLLAIVLGLGDQRFARVVARHVEVGDVLRIAGELLHRAHREALDGVRREEEGISSTSLTSRVAVVDFAARRARK